MDPCYDCKHSVNIDGTGLEIYCFMHEQYFLITDNEFCDVQSERKIKMTPEDRLNNLESLLKAHDERFQILEKEILNLQTLGEETVKLFIDHYKRTIRLVKTPTQCNLCGFDNNDHVDGCPNKK